MFITYLSTYMLTVLMLESATVMAVNKCERKPAVNMRAVSVSDRAVGQCSWLR